MCVSTTQCVSDKRKGNLPFFQKKSTVVWVFHCRLTQSPVLWHVHDRAFPPERVVGGSRGMCGRPSVLAAEAEGAVAMGAEEGTRADRTELSFGQAGEPQGSGFFLPTTKHNHRGFQTKKMTGNKSWGWDDVWVW